jgi:hypothetical protein
VRWVIGCTERPPLRLRLCACGDGNPGSDPQAPPAPSQTSSHLNVELQAATWIFPTHCHKQDQQVFVTHESTMASSRDVKDIMGLAGPTGAAPAAPAAKKPKPVATKRLSEKQRDKRYMIDMLTEDCSWHQSRSSSTTRRPRASRLHHRLHQDIPRKAQARLQARTLGLHSLHERRTQG